jgi:hypothetical protein
LKRFKHFKGTIYTQLGVSVPSEGTHHEVITSLSALHHDTQNIMLFSFINSQWVSPDDQSYVLYESEKDDRIWAREYDDFYGYKQHPDGTVERRFVPMDEEIVFTNEQPYERAAADIKVPDRYVDLLEATFKDYKKFLKENEKLQMVADRAETEEDRAEALKKATGHFKKRNAGFLGKDDGDRLSVSQIKRIWEKFMKDEYRGFLQSHTNMTMKEIITIGIDKFVYALGWKRPSDVPNWHKNRLRVGICCHCQDQFIPMMLQYNFGLCGLCKPMYSSKAIQNFVIHQLDISKRYEGAQHDLLMDFFIVFYHDQAFRHLFLKESDSAMEWEKITTAPELEVVEQ